MTDIDAIDSEIQNIIEGIYSKRFDKECDAYQFRNDVFKILNPLYMEKYRRHYEDRGYKKIEVRTYNNMIIQRYNIKPKYSHMYLTEAWGIIPYYTFDEFKQMYYTFLIPSGIMESRMSWLILLHIFDSNGEPVSPLSCNGTFCDAPGEMQ